MFGLRSPRTCGTLQRHPWDSKMAVVAVIPSFQTNQPFTGLGFLARHWSPLQPASAAGHPPPRCPDPAGRRTLADGTHRLAFRSLTSPTGGQDSGDLTKHLLNVYVMKQKCIYLFSVLRIACSSGGLLMWLLVACYLL